MAAVKQFICLANSRKLAGRCIAGREWTAERGAGNWVRPVSKRDNQEVSEYERQFEDGSDPRVLDIVKVPVVEPKPDGYQTENWLLNDEYYWQKTGRFSPLDLPQLTDPAEPLWIDGRSTHSGRNDKIPLDLASKLRSSLRLIRIPQLELAVFAPGEAFGNAKRRVQGQFNYDGNRYALWVTDPGYEKEYLAKLNGTYSLKECYLTISLGEPYQGACHKLIATIIEGAG